MGLSGHQSARMKSADWLTPPVWVSKLGPFDLDPACPADMPWRTAERMLSEGGLEAEWRGRVWLNPPFGKQARRWLAKLRDHGNGIGLVPARTETEMFYESVWGVADAVCFTGPHRPHFHVPRDTRFKVPGGRTVLVPAGMPAPFNSGAPIALIAYGQNNVEALECSGLGVVLKTRHPASE